MIVASTKELTLKENNPHLRQVNDFLIGTADKAAGKRLTKRIGKKVEFEHEKDPPTTFLGLVDDCKG